MNRISLTSPYLSATFLGKLMDTKRTVKAGMRLGICPHHWESGKKREQHS